MLKTADSCKLPRRRSGQKEVRLEVEGIWSDPENKYRLGVPLDHREAVQTDAHVLIIVRSGRRFLVVDEVLRVQLR
jgi:hypothetical protein